MVPTPDPLRDILTEILAAAAGGTREEWRDVIGEVRKLSVGANGRRAAQSGRLLPIGTRSSLGSTAPYLNAACRQMLDSPRSRG